MTNGNKILSEALNELIISVEHGNGGATHQTLKARAALKDARRTAAEELMRLLNEATGAHCRCQIIENGDKFGVSLSKNYFGEQETERLIGVALNNGCSVTINVAPGAGNQQWPTLTFHQNKGNFIGFP